MAAEIEFAFHEEAADDVRDAIAWQRKNRSDDRATRLIAAVDIGTAQICQAPERWPLVHGMDPPTRLRLLGGGFQYTLYYRIRPEGIFILAMASQQQEPFFWAHRH